jgi:hypothetical protein
MRHRKSAARHSKGATDNMPVWLGLLYLPLHFTVYALFLRRRTAFQTEAGIFLFHFVSACLFPLAALALSLGTGDALLYGIAAAAGHGIYSLSFLELWALSQGSYSFLVLRAVERDSTAGAEGVVTDLAMVGDAKKGQRLGSLEQLKLVARAGGSVSLTPRGQRVAAFLAAIQATANLRETG